MVNEYETLVQDYLRLYPDSKMKVCNKCKNKFPLSSHFFNKEKRIFDGFENTCKVCRGKSFIVIKSNEQNDWFELNNKTNDETIILYEHYVLSNSAPSKNFINDNYVKIIKYLIEEKYNMKDKDILLITREWIQKHKLYSVSIHTFNGSTVDMINHVYPNRFKPWQFITSGTNYWNNEENVKNALNWLIAKLFEDKVISSINDIPINVDGNTFNTYELNGLLSKKFKSHPFYAIDYILPNMFYEWEYGMSPEGYWHSKENRCAALKQVIETMLKLNLEDIPKLMSYMFFALHSKYNKFKYVIDRYYDMNLYEYINECYPQTFIRSDFPSKNRYLTLDNTRVRSEPERIIHHLLMNSEVTFQYEPKGMTFFNEDHNERYRPDWIVRDNIIVEYYGMLDMKDIDYGYDDKYLRKHEFYTALCNKDSKYIYIELIYDDMKNGMSGVKSKFSDIGITLESSYY